MGKEVKLGDYEPTENEGLKKNTPVQASHSNKCSVKKGGKETLKTHLVKNKESTRGGMRL